MNMTNQLTLCGRSSSSNVQKVLVLLEELNIACTRIGADMNFGDADNAEFRAMNPNVLMPILRHGDVTVWESHAILNYLAAVFGSGSFWQEDPAKRAIVDQWAIWATATLNPAISQVFYRTVLTPPSKHDAAGIKSAISAASKMLEILDAQLAENQFMTGNAYSIADIIAGALMYRWRTIDIERPSLPNVERWVTTLQQRPS